MSKRLSLEVKSINDLKILDKYPQYWKDITSFLVISSKTLSIKDKQGLIKRLKQINIPIHVESYSWWFTHPRTKQKLSDPENNPNFEKNPNLLFAIQNISEDLILEGWESTILHDKNFDCIDNWIGYQRNLNKNFRKKQQSLNKIKSLRSRLVKKDDAYAELESFSLPYIPIIDISGHKEEVKNAINANIEIIKYFNNKNTQTFKKQVCPSIVINFKAIECKSLEKLVNLIKDNFEMCWIWFADIDDRKLPEIDIRKLWKYIRYLNRGSKKIFRLRLGGFLSHRFLKNEFTSICSFIDGWGAYNFTPNYYQDEDITYYGRKRHVFSPQLGRFVSGNTLSKELEQKKCNFKCDCFACKKLIAESKLTIPEMEYKRNEARKEEKKLNIESVGVSQNKQSEFLRLHGMICFYNLLKTSDKEFSNLEKKWINPGLKKWKIIEKEMSRGD
ncbi:MAG: hypothetical protein ACTSRG_08315 [Candidatus Helarchaeota archaeon]